MARYSACGIMMATLLFPGSRLWQRPHSDHHAYKLRPRLLAFVQVLWSLDAYQGWMLPSALQSSRVKPRNAQLSWCCHG